MTERIIKTYELEYKKLKAIAAALEMLSPNGAQYVVEDVYLDYGQNWKWTTICRYGYRECQILCPKDWQDIMVIENANDLALVIDHIRNNDHFMDK